MYPLEPCIPPNRAKPKTTVDVHPIFGTQEEEEGGEFEREDMLAWIRRSNIAAYCLLPAYDLSLEKG